MSENLGDLLVIGGGNMGSALTAGVRRRSPMTRVMVVEPNASRHDGLRRVGAEVCTDAPAGLAWLRERDRSACDSSEAAVLLAVKPQMLDAATGAFRAASSESNSSRLVISILAGATCARVHAALGSGRIIRAMPNLPASIGQGITAICAGIGASPTDLERAERVLMCVGEVVRLPETLMDAFTALAGSGPAYLFYLAEAMERAASEMGIDASASAQIIRATLSGSAALLGASTETPGSLRTCVTSKGGTTEAAIRVLELEHVGTSITRAIVSARDRGRELGA